MKNPALACIVFIALLSHVSGQRLREIPDAAQFFRQFNVDGSFFLRDLNNDSTICYNPERLSQPETYELKSSPPHRRSPSAK